MKRFLICAVSFGLMASTGMTTASAEETLTREQIIAEYNKTYVPAFASLHSRLLAIKEKASKVAKLKNSWEYVMKDFEDETGIINTTVNDPKGDVSAILGYSQEETDEIGKQVAYLESQVSKIKTIKCVKGKTTKTITDVSAKCPNGYSLKK